MLSKNNISILYMVPESLLAIDRSMHCSELLSWLDCGAVASLLGRRCQWRSKQSNEKSEKPPSLGGAGGGATGSCKAIATCSGAGSVRQGAHFFSQQHSPSAHCAVPRVSKMKAVQPLVFAQMALQASHVSALRPPTLSDLFARSLLALLEECNPDASNERASHGMSLSL